MTISGHKISAAKISPYKNFRAQKYSRQKFNSISQFPYKNRLPGPGQAYGRPNIEGKGGVLGTRIPHVKSSRIPENHMGSPIGTKTDPQNGPPKAQKTPHMGLVT
jgi:hypothetical protein